MPLKNATNFTRCHYVRQLGGGGGGGTCSPPGQIATSREVGEFLQVKSDSNCSLATIFCHKAIALCHAVSNQITSLSPMSSQNPEVGGPIYK